VVEETFFNERDLSAEDVQRWLEGELVRLRLEADDLVRAYFREGRERSFSQKVWPRLKDYTDRMFYVTWSRREYINPQRGVVRTQHIKRGQGSYRRRLSQICRSLEIEERDFVLSYEDRFHQIRQQVELLVQMQGSLNKYCLGKEAPKNIYLGPEIVD